MRALIASDREGGVEALSLADRPYPHAAENDVIVRVHAASFTPGELDWPATWTDRAGRDRTPSIPGHEVSGVVAALGYGTTGLTVGQRVFGLTDWARDGALAEYVAVEARNLAPLPADISHVDAAGLPISGLTAWQGLVTHGALRAGQTVLVHGAAGAVGALAVQIARQVGATVLGSGRRSRRDAVLAIGAHGFVDLESDWVGSLEGVDVVFDVIGGDVLADSATVLRPGGTLVSVAEPPTPSRPDIRSSFFVVEPSRRQLTRLSRMVLDGRLTPQVAGTVSLDEAPAAFGRRPSGPGKVIVEVANDA